ncbi:MAG TPA: sigma-54-dependent Fis family transcriptional regulator, partial [Sedimenticola thiotaurini]|nr:sigma-54-dependent Fis family transcriptional regulator [Sedimenticola thiotaurini]
MPHILIIEDETVIRSAVRRLLERNQYQVTEAGSVEEAEREHPLQDFDLILCDLRLPGVSGNEVIARAQGVPVLIMTSYASVRSAVDSMKQGAVDYIAKPFDHDELLILIRRILEQHQLERRSEVMKSELDKAYPVDGMIGNCPAMQEVCRHIAKVAATDSTVLILGESGTGKELVARALHEQSRRHNAPIVTVNCAAIPDSLIESELFGHEKGAFTGAVGSRAGMIESANGGTLFLDEIGELSLTAQARLLRVLQNGEIRRVGSEQARHVDIRLISATHRDLKQLVQSGAFRSDL